MKAKQISSFILVAFCSTLLLSGCNTSETQLQSQQRLKQAENLMKNQPAPEFDYSMDRNNIILRLTRSNNKYNLEWIYPMSAGRVIGRIPVMGKVTSGGKRLNRISDLEGDSQGYHLIEQPDEMGTFGSSGDYIFWFDPAGNGPYQHSGDFIVSPVPLKLDTGLGTIVYEVDKSEEGKIESYEKQIKESRKKLDEEVKKAEELRNKLKSEQEKNNENK